MGYLPERTQTAGLPTGSGAESTLRFYPCVKCTYALLPIIFGATTGMQNMSLGGTSLIILVGVALETVKQMESQMMMRHYKGFLD